MIIDSCISGVMGSIYSQGSQKRLLVFLGVFGRYKRILQGKERRLVTIGLTVILGVSTVLSHIGFYHLALILLCIPIGDLVNTSDDDTKSYEIIHIHDFSYFCVPGAPKDLPYIIGVYTT